MSEAAVLVCGCAGFYEQQIQGIDEQGFMYGEETLQFDLCDEHDRTHGDESWWEENDAPRVSGCSCPVCELDHETVEEEWEAFKERARGL